MQEASIPAWHQAGSLIPGAPTSQFQHWPPCNRSQTGEHRKLRFLHALTFYQHGAPNSTHFPNPPPFLVLQNHHPGKCQPRALVPRAASHMPLPGTGITQGCLFGWEGQATSTASAQLSSSATWPGEHLPTPGACWLQQHFTLS